MGFMLRFGLIGLIIAVVVIFFVVKSIIRKAWKIAGILIVGLAAFYALSYFGLINFITGM